MTLCFATNNQHKIDEVAALLGSHFTLLSLRDIGCHETLAEDFFTMEENSRQKAEYVFSKSKVPCFADDSGLEVEALHGQPGVDSAHYAGPQRSHDDNMNLVLQKLSNIQYRKAQFRTVITLFEANGVSRQFEGTVTGNIIHEKRGTMGFGYDPIFMPDGYSKTLAEMTMAEKNAISHRAMAVANLVAYLKERQH